MVRTYRNDRQALVSPWEKAMRNADAKEGRPINTGKRVYADLRIGNTSLEHQSTPRTLKLPPITEDPQQMIQFLGEEVGKALARSKEKLKKMKKEFILYDPQETSMMSKTSAFEILTRYKIPNNENYQKKVLAFFVSQDEPSKINYKKMTEFFENSKKNYQEKIELADKQQELNSEGRSIITDNTHGRYDSHSTDHQIRNKPRKAHEQAFKERRDVGLMLEIEKALKTYRGETSPDDLIDALEDSLQNTCRNDDFQTDNGHVKSLVNKHSIPINSALILKCIERLDPFNTGSIEWPKFIEFFRKAIGSPIRSVRTSSQTSSSNYNHPPPQQLSPQFHEVIPDRPAWETRQPLSSIGNNNNHDVNKNKWETTSHSIPLNDSYNNNDALWGHENSSNNNNNNNNNSYEYDSNTNHDYLYDQTNDLFYGQNQAPVDENNEFPAMDNDLEAAFAKSVDELRSNSAYDNSIEEPNKDEQQTFEEHGERGNIYKMVAGALNDKAKHNNGRLHTNDVRKIMNYYNLLFDADFPMDQINAILHRYSDQDEVYSEQIINMFGKEIV